MTLSLALLAATFLNPLAAWPGILSLALTPLSIYLAYWTIARALSDRSASFTGSFGVMNGSFLRGLGYFLIAFIPVFVLHYAFSILAIGESDQSVWLLLTLDSLLVGLIPLFTFGATYFAARWAKHRTSQIGVEVNV